MSIFGSPKKFLVDNDGELNNEDFHLLCENVNICILTTAAESPWSNSLKERHNAIVGYTVSKIMMLVVTLNSLYHGQWQQRTH